MTGVGLGNDLAAQRARATIVLGKPPPRRTDGAGTDMFLEIAWLKRAAGMRYLLRVVLTIESSKSAAIRSRTLAAVSARCKPSDHGRHLGQRTLVWLPILGRPCYGCGSRKMVPQV